MKFYAKTMKARKARKDAKKKAKKQPTGAGW